MALSSTTAFVGQLMTLETTIFHVELVTIPSTTKTSFSRIMWRSAHNETSNVKAYNCILHTTCPFFQVKAYMTFLMASCVVIH